MKASNCCCNWKTGGIIIGIFSLIGSFPVSASGDVSVSLHFLVVSGCLLYGIFKEKSEFLLPYLVELVIILIQCALSILKFVLLDPYEEDSFETDIAYDLFYDRPKHLTKEEKRFILAALIFTSVVITGFWCIIFTLYRRMRYCKEDVDDDNNDDNNSDNNNKNDGVRTVECAKESRIYPDISE